MDMDAHVDACVRGWMVPKGQRFAIERPRSLVQTCASVHKFHVLPGFCALRHFFFFCWLVCVRAWWVIMCVLITHSPTCESQQSITQPSIHLAQFDIRRTERMPQPPLMMSTSCCTFLLLPGLIPFIRLHGFVMCAYPIVASQWGSLEYQTRCELCHDPSQGAPWCTATRSSGLPIVRWHANHKPRHKGCIIALSDRTIPWRVAVHRRALDSPRRVVTE
ncbi:uncharacterized protein B0J16DRAFT_338309 [Fusarium flagelliforme]|uniref:uncharacterized protein n=1 Tax=Fusarium flagelliforme TaxID=2675880 RepID=UPI001E8EEFC1|nr:uncharacterized protein B0J16DRAFT_338309 [Fusarium flagelliforme]KAH7188893.1 hypothetical protein B0J16DRAFT_338309 [Fusarium flagelliforme]